MRIYRKDLTVSLLCLFLLLTSCTTVRNTPNYAGEYAHKGVYHLTEEQADQVLKEALQQHFAGDPISKIEAPYKGYSVTMRFFIDSQTLTAMMIGTPGKYSFQVQSSGTLLISGNVKAKRLLDTIHTLASTYEDREK